MRRWIWRQIEVSLPEDWELLQFSRNPEQGSCAFADRHQFRFELRWREVPGVPDFERMLGDVRAKLETEDAARIRAGTVQDWHTLEARESAGYRTHASRFFGDTDTADAAGLLVEATLLWPAKPDRKAAADMLKDIRFLAPEDGRVAWAAFGMAMWPSHDLRLESADVKPAHAELTWRNDRGKRVERFARRGLVDVWLEQPLETWLQQWAASEGELRALPPRGMPAGHNVAGFESTGRGKRIRRPPSLRAEAWICPRDGRLYAACFTAGGRDAFAGQTLAGQRLACCGEMTP